MPRDETTWHTRHPESFVGTPFDPSGLFTPTTRVGAVSPERTPRMAAPTGWPVLSVLVQFFTSCVPYEL